eukprot:5618850-Prymnesium_polylepis.2
MEQSLSVRYVYSFYWAVGITCQVNFPVPDTATQQIFSVVSAAGGVLSLSLIVGSATTVVADLQTQRTEISKGLQRIGRYMRYKRLPLPLRRRIISYYSFQYSQSH